MLTLILAKYLTFKGLALCPINRTQNDTGNSSRKNGEIKKSRRNAIPSFEAINFPGAFKLNDGNGSASVQTPNSPLFGVCVVLVKYDNITKKLLAQVKGELSFAAALCSD